MKKLLTITLIFIFLFLCLIALTVGASAETCTGTCGDNLTWSLDTEIGVLHIEGTGKMEDFLTYSGPWASYRSFIKTLDIANGVTGIGEFAFADCVSLTGVEIPSSVTYIGPAAFVSCVNLKSVTFAPNSKLTRIDYRAFSGCSVLETIHFPEGLEEIGQYSFDYCTNLINVTIPDSIAEIARFTFDECRNLNYTVFGGAKYLGNEENPYVALVKPETDSVTSILVHPETVVIADAALESCKALESITFQSPLTEIISMNYGIPSTAIIYGYEGSTAQAYAEKYGRTFIMLESFSIDGFSFTKTTDGTYYTVTGYEGTSTEVVIPSTYEGLPVTRIGFGAFAYCSNLTSITIPDSVTSIGYKAFYYCSSLTSITVPDGVTSIKGGTFANCSGLTSISIPDNVTSIGNNAFQGCSSLTSITFESPTTLIYDSQNTISDTAVLYGYEVSTAQAYAEKYGRNFAVIDGAEHQHFVVVPAVETILVPAIEVYEEENWEKCGTVTITALDDCELILSYGIEVHRPADYVAPVEVWLNNSVYDNTSLEGTVVFSLRAGEYVVLSFNTNLNVAAYSRGYYSIDTMPMTDIAVETTKRVLAETQSATCTEAVVCAGCGVEVKPMLAHAWDQGKVTTQPTQLTEGVKTYTCAGCGATKTESVPTLIEFTLNADGASYSVTGYTGTDTALLIPTMKGGLPITAIQSGILLPVIESEENTPSQDSPIIMPDDTLWAPSRIEQITFLSRTIVIEDAVNTIPAGITIYGYVNSTAHQYALKYGREFVILPEIASANIALGSDITVNYLAYLDDSQKDAVMKFTVGGVTTTVQGVATATPNRYQFSFTGINPQMMGDNIAVELVLNGETLAEMGAYSVKQYCVNMKSRVAAKSITGFSDAQYAALDTLLSDILEYGAAAQVYKNYKPTNLVNAGITGASEFIPLTSAHKMPAFDASTMPDAAAFTAAKVVLSNVIQLRFDFKTTDVSRVTIKVGNRIYNQDNFTLVSSQSDGFGVATEVYSLSSDAIFADQMETSYTLILCVDGVECQRLKYSVVNYIYNMQNTTSDPDLVELLKRIRNYGLSAVAYRDAQ